MSDAMSNALTVAFDVAGAQSATDEWGFNCGPAALCAVTGKTPAEIRPQLGDFESKGYTNPTLMADSLRRLRVAFKRLFEVPRRPLPENVIWPTFGLVRVQWGGPWTNDGVPLKARYRHSHWIAYAAESNGRVFDVNAMCIGGWLDFEKWSTELVPWLLKQVEPKASGEWWPTHCWEIES